MKAMNRSPAKDIRRDTVSTMNPEWRALVERNAVTEQDRKVVARGARIQGGNPPTAIAASSKRALSGGMVPVESWAAVEFGANGDRVTTYDRKSKSGGTHKVRRHTTRQLPRRNPKGRIAYPAFGELGPRLVSLWVQTIVRRVHEAFEGRQ